MKTRIISSILIIVFAIFLQTLLLDLFPNPGPGTMGSVPITYLTSVILAVLNFFIIKKIIQIWKKLVYFLIIFIGFSVFTIDSYPQEKPFEQVLLAYSLYRNPNEIRYEYLYKPNYQKQAVYVTAALVKFKDSLPDQAFLVSYCCEPSKEYYIAKYGTKYKTNNSKLLIDRTSKKDTIIFKDSYKGQIVEFSSPPDVFGNLTGWGQYIDNETKENTIHFSKCDLKPMRGFNKVYYDFLK